MNYDNKVKVEMESKSQNESLARVIVATFVSILDPTINEMNDIKTAVSEAVTNAIIHGYEEKEGIITLNCYLKGDTITIEVIDNGIGIENIEEARVPLYTSKPSMERSGMGFTVMETFMDKVTIHTGIGIGTKVIMSKKIISSLK